MVLNVDGRSSWARRKRDLIELHLADLGGFENTSEAQRAIVGLASTLKVELEQLDSRFSTNGGATAAELDLYSRVAGNCRRLLESIGLERRAKPVNGLPVLLGDGL